MGPHVSRLLPGWANPGLTRGMAGSCHMPRMFPGWGRAGHESPAASARRRVQPGLRTATSYSQPGTPAQAGGPSLLPHHHHLPRWLHPGSVSPGESQLDPGPSAHLCFGRCSWGSPRTYVFCSPVSGRTRSSHVGSALCLYTPESAFLGAVNQPPEISHFLQLVPWPCSTQPLAPPLVACPNPISMGMLSLHL